LSASKAFIGDHRFCFEPRQEYIGSVQLAGLACGEMEARRVAERIDFEVRSMAANK
jgi:hypothetical protein